jgi:hypothetical protein
MREDMNISKEMRDGGEKKKRESEEKMKKMK